MPSELVEQAVDVLLELPREPRLADSTYPEHRDEPGLVLLCSRMEGVLDHPELALSSHKRSLEPARAPLPAPRGDDPGRAREDDRLRPAAKLVRACVLVRDRCFGRAPRRFVDEDVSRLGQRLDAGGSVHKVAGDKALVLGADGDGCLARHYRCAGLKAGQPCIALEGCDDLHELERGSHSAFGIVLPRYRSAPECHHRVADELLDRPAIAVDHLPSAVVEIHERGRIHSHNAAVFDRDAAVFNHAVRAVHRDDRSAPDDQIHFDVRSLCHGLGCQGKQ